MTDPVLLDHCWPVDPGCLGTAWDDFPDDVQDRALALATATLYRLTLGQVGGCPVTARPCPSAPPARPISPFMYGGGWMSPAQTSSGAWVNCLCGGGGCGCSTGCEIVLPGYVGRLDAVQVGATVLTSSDYALIRRSGKFVVVWRGSTDCPFPTSQDLSKPLGQPNTLGVTYLPAREVDIGGAEAAGLLAVEFAKDCSGKDCQLPKTVRSINRQGVSMQLVVGAFENGLTGIRRVDAWVALYNPKGSKGSVTQVWSPDMDEVVYE